MRWKHAITFGLALTTSACGAGGGNDKPTTVVENKKPTAVITSPIGIIETHSPAEFNAAMSFDPDGDALTYEWFLKSADGAQNYPINNPTLKTVQLSFPDAQEYKIVLVVSDGKASTQAEKNISVRASNNPIAKAGGDKTVKQGEVVLLSGIESTAVQTKIQKYRWTLTQKPASSIATLANRNRVTTQFIADEPGVYVAQLQVTDSFGRQGSDEVVITAESTFANSTPQAIILAEKQIVLPNEVLVLDGSQSFDPDFSDQLSYLWQVVSKPTESQVSLTQENTVTASFAADALGQYDLQLDVTDQHGAVGTASITLTVTQGNQAPVVELAQSLNVLVGEETTLRCARCFDPDGDLLTYQWLLVAKPETSNSTLQGATLSIPKLTADVSGDYVVSLTVSDGNLHSNTATMVIQAADNLAPIATIADVAPVLVNQRVNLDASSSSDPEGQSLTYQWQVVSSPVAITLSDAHTATPYFTPENSGEYVIALVVSDGVNESAPVTKRIIVNDNQSPVVVLQGAAERTIELGERVFIDASASYDPEQDNLTFAWQLDKPQNSNAVLDVNWGPQVNFNPDVAGTYFARLTLKDSFGNEVNNAVKVTVNEAPAVVSGMVKGRLLTPKYVGIANAALNLNGQSIKTDANGNFEQLVTLDNVKTVAIQSEDQRIADIQFTSNTIANNNFIVNLGDMTVPMYRDYNVYLTPCSSYQGAENVDITFTAKTAVPEMKHFSFNYQKTFSLSTKQATLLSLPTSAIYQLSVADTLKLTSGEEANFYYDATSTGIRFLSVCNK